MTALVVAIVVALLVIIVIAKSVRIIPQARVGVVERLGKYKRSLGAGMSLLTPFIERVRYMIDLREQVVSFPPQNVITEDNLVVAIDTVIYFQVTEPVRATYEVANYIQAIEQLTQTTLRNIVGGMDLERTLTSREEINRELGAVLDQATGKWGVKVNRVELKGIDPPPSIQDSMEKQMRADRDKRAAVLTAEGVRQSAILTAEGEKQSAILSAEGERQAKILRAQADREADILRAQGQAQAIETVFGAIHQGRPTQELLSYQYLQMLPKVAEGSANKVWIVPSELGKALEGLGQVAGQLTGGASAPLSAGEQAAAAEVEVRQTANEHEAKAVKEAEQVSESAVQSAQDEVAAAIAAAEDAAQGRIGTGAPHPTGDGPSAGDGAPGPDASGAAGPGAAGAAPGSSSGGDGAGGAAPSEPRDAGPSGPSAPPAGPASA